MSLADFHARLAISAILYALVLGLWAFWRYFRRQGVHSSYFGALVIAEILFLAQGALGGYMWLTGLRPERGGIHILYGVVGALTIPGVYLFTKGREERRETLIYALAMIFATGILLRAMTTGG